MYALQLATAGLAIGSVYALIAIGVVLIYKCSGVVNFAQGAFVMLGAYFTYAITRLGLTPVIAVFLSTVLMAAAGAATERLVLRPMLKAPVVAIMMVTLGVLIFLRAVALAVWGPDQIAFPKLFPDGAIEIFGNLYHLQLPYGGLTLNLSRIGVPRLLSLYRHRPDAALYRR